MTDFRNFPKGLKPQLDFAAGKGLQAAKYEVVSVLPTEDGKIKVTAQFIKAPEAGDIGKKGATRIQCSGVFSHGHLDKSSVRFIVKHVGGGKEHQVLCKDDKSCQEYSAALVFQDATTPQEAAMMVDLLSSLPEVEAQSSGDPITDAGFVLEAMPHAVFDVKTPPLLNADRSKSFVSLADLKVPMDMPEGATLTVKIGSVASKESSFVIKGQKLKPGEMVHIGVSGKALPADGVIGVTYTINTPSHSYMRREQLTLTTDLPIIRAPAPAVPAPAAAPVPVAATPASPPAAVASPPSAAIAPASTPRIASDLDTSGFMNRIPGPRGGSVASDPAVQGESGSLSREIKSLTPRIRTEYNRVLANNGTAGPLLVSFQVGKDGKATGLKVERSSGNNAFDRQVLSIIAKHKFPNRAEESGVINVPFNFQAAGQ